jgi:outer membrane protein assembly factor BamB
MSSCVLLSGGKWAVVCAVVIGAAAPGAALAQWTQWGGPNRDFSVAASGLADRWPDAGPKKLWERPLGEGYSTILADGGMLFTMYREGDDEFVIALGAKSGKTVWEHKNAAPIDDDRKTYGPGPYATPLIVGDRLYTVGTNSVLHCFEKKSGRVVWRHDLVAEFGAAIQGFGYSSSPIAYKGTIILPVGRTTPSDAADDATEKDAGKKKEKLQQQSLMAFDQTSGSLVWENKDYDLTSHDSTYSSPILINFAGRDQLVLFMTSELAGLDPANGNRLWGVAHTTSYDENMATPVFDGKDTIVCSSAYGTGSRGIRLTQKGAKTIATELWYSKKMRVLHGNMVAVGGYAYGSSGDFGPTFFAGIDMATGKMVWRKRGYKKATCLGAGGKLIILDEDGLLALTTASPGDLAVHAKYDLKMHGAWAVPTLVGKTLFVRDRERIMALDLG